MKRLTAAMLAILFTISVFSGMANASETTTEHYTTVRSSIDVKVGDRETAAFTLDTNGISARNIELKDENGKTIAKMLDSGKKGDEKADDGIYSAKLDLNSDTRAIVKYTAYVDGEAYREYEVNYYNDITENDEAQMQRVYDGINAIEADMESKGASDDEIFNAVVAYIKTCDCIEDVEVKDSSCAYTAKSGISSLYARFAEDVKGAGEPTNNAVAVTANGDELDLNEVNVSKGNENLQSWTNPNVLLVRPFRTVAGQEGFHNDRYIDAGKLITGYTNGYITVLDNEETIPYNLLETFWQNGFVMVDSHGLTGYDKSYICVWEGAGYDSADVSARRVMKTNDTTHVYISGEYFRHYYEQMNRKMENTFLYFGVCYGMTYDTLRTPFFEMGAVCAYGYDNSVSMGYEGYNLLTMYPYLTTICEQDNTRTYNLEEAVAEAIRKNGDTDPYGTFGAHIEAHGDTKFVIYKPDVPVTGVKMNESEVEGIVGTNCYIPITLMPEKMVYGYTQEWTSSDPDVAEVIGTRMLKCKKEGEITVTVKITYGDRVFEDNCKVVVSEVMPQSITAICSGANTIFKVGQAREIYAELQPVNAGNKTICYTSNNPGVVSVDDNGKVLSYRPGKAIITAYAEADPNVKADVAIEVSEDMVYKAGSTMDYINKFMIITNDRNAAALCGVENSSYPNFMQARSMSNVSGYYSGNISSICLWQFKKAAGGFYIYNESLNMYLSMSNEEGVMCLTENPVSIFAYSDNGRIYVTNPIIETEDVYIKLNTNKGFYLSSSGSKFDFAKALNFSSDNYVSVTFKDENNIIATQKVEKGEKAIAAVVTEKSGKTFLGWNTCLANVMENITAEAVYENGESDMLIITFMDYDGTILGREELKPGETCEPPTVPEHEGYRFVGWSEDIKNINTNTIVFAMYVNDMLGDVNMDGTVNTADAVMILKNSAELIALDSEQLSVADVTGDGNVNTADAVLILKFAAGLVTEF